jgi:MFS family permease
MFDLTASRGARAVTAGLVVAGLLPLLLAAISQWAPLGRMDAELGLRVGVTYAAVVLAFLGGARCGLALYRLALRDAPHETAAGVATVLAAFLSLMLPALACICLQVAAFMLLGLWDIMGAERGYVPEWYARLRNIVTPVAVLSLMAMLVRLAL